MEDTQVLECTQAIPFDESYQEESSKKIEGWLEIKDIRHELFLGENKIGRDPKSCSVILSGCAGVSKEHAVLTVEKEGATLCDLGSRNFTRINELKLKPKRYYVLNGSETLRFGDVLGKFYINEQNLESRNDSDNISESSNESESLLATIAPDDPIHLINSPTASPTKLDNDRNSSQATTVSTSTTDDSKGTKPQICPEIKSNSTNVSHSGNEDGLPTDPPANAALTDADCSADDSFIPCTSDALYASSFMPENNKNRTTSTLSPSKKGVSFYTRKGLFSPVGVTKSVTTVEESDDEYDDDDSIISPTPYQSHPVTEASVTSVPVAAMNTPIAISKKLQVIPETPCGFPLVSSSVSQSTPLRQIEPGKATCIDESNVSSFLFDESKTNDSKTASLAEDQHVAHNGTSSSTNKEDNKNSEVATDNYNSDVSTDLSETDDENSDTVLEEKYKKVHKKENEGDINSLFDMQTQMTPATQAFEETNSKQSVDNGLADSVPSTQDILDAFDGVNNCNNESKLSSNIGNETQDVLSAFNTSLESSPKRNGEGSIFKKPVGTPRSAKKSENKSADTSINAYRSENNIYEMATQVFTEPVENTENNIADAATQVLADDNFSSAATQIFNDDETQADNNELAKLTLQDSLTDSMSDLATQPFCLDKNQSQINILGEGQKKAIVDPSEPPLKDAMCEDNLSESISNMATRPFEGDTLSCKNTVAPAAHDSSIESLSNLPTQPFEGDTLSCKNTVAPSAAHDSSIESLSNLPTQPFKVDCDIATNDLNETLGSMLTQPFKEDTFSKAVSRPAGNSTPSHLKQFPDFPLDESISDLPTQPFNDDVHLLKDGESEQSCNNSRTLRLSDSFSDLSTMKVNLSIKSNETSTRKIILDDSYSNMATQPFQEDIEKLASDCKVPCVDNVDTQPLNDEVDGSKDNSSLECNESSKPFCLEVQHSSPASINKAIGDDDTEQIKLDECETQDFNTLPNLVSDDTHTQDAFSDETQDFIEAHTQKSNSFHEPSNKNLPNQESPEVNSSKDDDKAALCTHQKPSVTVPDDSLLTPTLTRHDTGSSHSIPIVPTPLSTLQDDMESSDEDDTSSCASDTLLKELPSLDEILSPLKMNVKECKEPNAISDEINAHIESKQIAESSSYVEISRPTSEAKVSEARNNIEAAKDSDECNREDYNTSVSTDDEDCKDGNNDFCTKEKRSSVAQNTTADGVAPNNTAHDARNITAHDAPITTVHDAQNATAHDAPITTVHDAQNATTHDAQNTTAHAAQNTIAHDAQNITGHDAQNTTAHDTPNTTAHDAPNTTAHDTPNTTAHDAPNTTADNLQKTVSIELDYEPVYDSDESAINVSSEDFTFVTDSECMPENKTDYHSSSPPHSKYEQSTSGQRNISSILADQSLRAGRDSSDSDSYRSSSPPLFSMSLSMHTCSLTDDFNDVKESLDDNAAVNNAEPSCSSSDAPGEPILSQSFHGFTGSPTKVNSADSSSISVLNKEEITDDDDIELVKMPATRKGLKGKGVSNKRKSDSDVNSVTKLSKCDTSTSCIQLASSSSTAHSSSVTTKSSVCTRRSVRRLGSPEWKTNVENKLNTSNEKFMAKTKRSAKAVVKLINNKSASEPSLSVIGSKQTSKNTIVIEPSLKQFKSTTATNNESETQHSAPKPNVVVINNNIEVDNIRPLVHVVRPPNSVECKSSSNKIDKECMSVAENTVDNKRQSRRLRRAPSRFSPDRSLGAGVDDTMVDIPDLAAPLKVTTRKRGRPSSKTNTIKSELNSSSQKVAGVDDTMVESPDLAAPPKVTTRKRGRPLSSKTNIIKNELNCSSQIVAKGGPSNGSQGDSMASPNVAVSVESSTNESNKLSLPATSNTVQTKTVNVRTTRSRASIATCTPSKSLQPTWNTKFSRKSLAASKVSTKKQIKQSSTSSLLASVIQEQENESLQSSSNSVCVINNKNVAVELTTKSTHNKSNKSVVKQEKIVISTHAAANKHNSQKESSPLATTDVSEIEAISSSKELAAPKPPATRRNKRARQSETSKSVTKDDQPLIKRLRQEPQVVTADEQPSSSCVLNESAESVESFSSTISGKKKGKGRPPSTPSSSSRRTTIMRGAASILGSPAPSDLSSPSMRQNRASNRPRVLFTGMVPSKEQERVLKKLGATTVESATQCSVLIATNCKRTCKLLACVAKGIPVVNSTWLRASQIAACFTDPWQHILKDAELEHKFKFDLYKTLTRAKSGHKLFSGYSIHCTDHVKPPPDQMRELVLCGGGEYLDLPPKSHYSSIVVVTCPEDQSSWQRFKKLKLPLVSTEFILTGILRGEANVKEHTIS